MHFCEESGENVAHIQYLLLFQFENSYFHRLRIQNLFFSFFVQFLHSRDERVRRFLGRLIHFTSLTSAILFHVRGLRMRERRSLN